MAAVLILLTAVCFFTGDDTKEQPVRDSLRLVGMVILALCCIAVVLNVLAGAILG